MIDEHKPVGVASAMHLASLELDIQEAERKVREARQAFRAKRIDRTEYIAALWVLQEAVESARMHLLYAWEVEIRKAREDADK